MYDSSSLIEKGSINRTMIENCKATAERKAKQGNNQTLNLFKIKMLWRDL